MNFNHGLIFLIVGILFFMTSVLSYLGDPSYSYPIPLVFCALVIIITALFEFRAYYNKNVYWMLLTLVLIVMWVIIYIRSLYLSVDKILSYAGAGIITLLIAWTSYKILQLDPEDATALYNKGVLIEKNANYRKSKEYINKALKLDPELEKASKSGKLLLKAKKIYVKRR